jgi:hypothetical protein
MTGDFTQNPRGEGRECKRDVTTADLTNAAASIPPDPIVVVDKRKQRLTLITARPGGIYGCAAVVGARCRGGSSLRALHSGINLPAGIPRVD